MPAKPPPPPPRRPRPLPPPRFGDTEADTKGGSSFDMTVFRPYLGPFQTAKPAQRLELIELVHAFARATPARRREVLVLLGKLDPHPARRSSPSED